MIRRTLAVAVAALAVVLVAGCGDSGGGGSSGAVPQPGIKFVGNDSCPASGQAPYYTDSGGNPVAPPVNASPAVGQPIDEMPHSHINPPSTVNYNHDPPTSGCHYSVANVAPIQQGFYDQPVPNEAWVHNLEHGYIAVLYNCPNGCPADVQTLRNWYNALPSTQCGGIADKYVIILPYKSLATKFAVESWDWYDPINGALDINEIQRFYNNHHGQQPEKGVC